MTGPRRADIATTIRSLDPAFHRVIDECGPPPARRISPVDQRFSSLVRSITFQLLATRAANTIHERVVAACRDEVQPERLLRVGEAGLRDAGLSTTKARAMLELARCATRGQIALERHGRMSDEEVIADVTRVRGIGPWTAQMYLMNTLGRHDVWPVGDYGVRQGWSLAHGLSDLISERDLRVSGEPFQGVRSSLAWYCWRVVALERLQ